MKFLFVFATLLFEIFMHTHSIPSPKENEKAGNFFKRRFLKKGWIILHGKYQFLLDMSFLQRDKQACFKIEVERCASYLSSDVKVVGLSWMNRCLWEHNNQSLFWCFVWTYRSNTAWENPVIYTF
jgi:hypothetical protein